MIRNAVVVVILSLGGLTDLAGQSSVMWHRTPEYRDGIIRYFAVADDNVIWCTDHTGVFRVELTGGRPIAEYRYYSEGDFSSIQVLGSTVVLVDVMNTGQKNHVVRSSDGGLTWNTVDIGRPDLVPVVLRCDEEGDLFLGCSNATMLTSRDSGKTWELFVEFERIQNSTNYVPSSISRNGDEYYCTVVDYSRKMGGAVNRYYRRDRTGTWSDISIEGSSGGTGTAEWEIGSLSGDALYGTYYDHENNMKIRMSFDRGETWEEPWSGTLGLQEWTQGPGSIANAEGDIYIGREASQFDEAVSVSRDSGKSFVDVIPEGYVASFARGPEGTIWVLAGRPGLSLVYSLWRETDTSDQFELVLGERDLEFVYPLSKRTVKKIAVRPWSNSGAWYAVVDSAGVWHTSNLGKSWLPILPVVTRNWKTLRDVETFEPTESIYLAGAEGIDTIGTGLRVLWEPIAGQIDVVAFEVARDRGIIVESSDGRILRVDGSGVTEEMGPEKSASDGREHLLDVDSYGRAFVSGVEGLYYLPVASPGWREIPIPPEIDPAGIAMAAISDLNTLTLSTETGVVTSTDFGVTWRDWGLGIRPVDQVLAITGRNIETGVAEPVILAVAGDSIWHSSNLGASWVNINGDLPVGRISAIAFDARANCIIVAVQGEGVFWLSSPPVSGVEEGFLVGEEAVGPIVQGDGRVRISIVGDYQPTITLYDLLGRQVPGDVVWSHSGDRFTGILSPESSCPKFLFIRVSQPDSSALQLWKVILP